MDAYTVLTALYQCIAERYPEAGGAILQVIGAAAVIRKVLAWIGTTEYTGKGMGATLRALSKLALSK